MATTSVSCWITEEWISIIHLANIFIEQLPCARPHSSNQKETEQMWASRHVPYKAGDQK